MDEELPISAQAVAILEFVTPRQAPAGELLYLTSKESFVWAGLATSIGLRGEVVDDLELTLAVMRAINTYKRNIAQATRSPPYVQWTRQTGLVVSHSGHSDASLVFQAVLHNLQSVVNDSSLGAVWRAR